MSSGDNLVEQARRRGAAARAGHAGDEPGARRALSDPAPAVRATGLGALARMGRAQVADLEAALTDPAPEVRRRACLVAGAGPGAGPPKRVGLELAPSLTLALADPDPLVVEAAAWALGERRERHTVAPLARLARDHDDPLCREAAVAALGAIGDAMGLSAILGALTDRPAVRRRAVIALAPFEGPEVEQALERARLDRDWQVRQAAEDLTSSPADADDLA